LLDLDWDWELKWESRWSCLSLGAECGVDEEVLGVSCVSGSRKASGCCEFC